MNKVLMLSAGLRFFFFAAVILSASQYLSAQPGTPDLSFNGNGLLFTGNNSVIKVQPDGKILVGGGTSDFQLIRYKINGAIDSSFGNNGIVVTDLGSTREYIQSIFIQPDGKIIAAGYTIDILSNISSFAIVHYFANGSLDRSFNGDGKIITEISGPFNHITLQNDGKIVMVGSQGQSYSILPDSFVVRRITSEGQPDVSFGSGGIVTTGFGYQAAANSVIVQNDGKIIVVGFSTANYFGFNADSLAMARYNANGSLDNTFNGNGKLTMVYTIDSIERTGDGARSVALDGDGKIIVGGSSWLSQSHGLWLIGDFEVMRFNSNGTLDHTFNGNGRQTVDLLARDEGAEVVVQSDDRILVAGTSGDPEQFYPQFSMARIDKNGHVDSSFGSAGKVIVNLPDSDGEINYGTFSNIVLSGHRIYLAGSGRSANFVAAAFQNDGIPFNPLDIILCPPAASTTISSDFAGATYQWQVSTDNVVFNNIINNTNYNGASTSTLSLNNIPSSWYGNQYRCIVSSGISNVSAIRFSNEWVGGLSNAWEDPSNWLCGKVPDVNTAVVINNGTLVIHSNVSIRNLTINSAASLTVGTGYTLTITH